MNQRCRPPRIIIVVAVGFCDKKWGRQLTAQSASSVPMAASRYSEYPARLPSPILCCIKSSPGLNVFEAMGKAIYTHQHRGMRLIFQVVIAKRQSIASMASEKAWLSIAG